MPPWAGLLCDDPGLDLSMFDGPRASRPPAMGAHGMGPHVTGGRNVLEIVKILGCARPGKRVK